MANHYPIEVPLKFDCVASDLLRFDWQASSADFVIPDDEAHILRVWFDTDVIVRLLDEMPLSIETDPSASRGLVPHHFAYRVEGASFGENHPEAWRDVLGSMKHYRFITGGGCLDALSRNEPRFAVVPAPR
jgi:hypothetical protein